jgi:hypothetical protein
VRGAEVSWELAAAVLLTGVVCLAVATIVARRTPAPGPGQRGSVLSLLTPWLGVLLTVVLLGRGSRTAALVVLGATAVAVGVHRWRASTATRREH